MKTAFTLSLAFLIAGSSACVRSPNRTEPKQADVITREQLMRDHFNSAFDAVQALHSNWLLNRPDNYRAQTWVVVYYDNVRLGGVETLQTIRVRIVSFIKHYNGIDATARWGLDHGSGVIYVSTQPVVLPASVSTR